MAYLYFLLFLYVMNISLNQSEKTKMCQAKGQGAIQTSELTKICAKQVQPNSIIPSPLCDWIESSRAVSRSEN